MSARGVTQGRLSRSLAKHGLHGARIAIVLGSGLGEVSRRLAAARVVPFTEIDGMPRSAVPGHAGRFVIGEIEGVPVLVQEGRVHLYEGWNAMDVCASVRGITELGCRCIVLTNASGGIRPGWAPPLLMRITDHIDRQGTTALERSEAGCGSPYDRALGSAIDHAAEEARVSLERGVYAGLLGPSYETPAEVRMLAWMGADAVGMSTVCEAQAAHASGARVAAISCVTNLAAGIGEGSLSHDEVIRAGAQSAEAIASLLVRAVPRLARALAGG